MLNVVCKTSLPPEPCFVVAVLLAFATCPSRGVVLLTLTLGIRAEESGWDVALLGFSGGLGSARLGLRTLEVFSNRAFSDSGSVTRQHPDFGERRYPGTTGT